MKTITEIKKALHLHFFKFRFKKGNNNYYQCRCGAKRVNSNEGCYSPIDWTWLRN